MARRWILALALLAVTPAATVAASAAPGDLDTTFGGDGKVVTNFTSGDDLAVAVVIQSDGKIVAAGRAAGSRGRFALTRYNADGTLDTTFSGDGKVATNFTPGDDLAFGVAIQSDGKIVAAGHAGGANHKFALARYNSDGTLDTTFAGDGRQTTDFTSGDDFAWDVTIQSDGKIVAAGLARGLGGKFALVRFNGDGTLDTSFSGDGKVTTNFTGGFDIATAVVVQTDGKIVAAGGVRGAGGRIGLARYNSDGSLDTAFAGDGRQTTDFTSGNDFAFDVALQSDGKIVAAGRAGGAGGRFALARYLIA